MKRPRFITEFTNIRVLPSGYQVALTRGGHEFSRHFAGHTASSLRAAMRFRDRALRELPPKRLNLIPRAMVIAAGLNEPAVGVFRKPTRSMYEVSYEEKGRRIARAFAWGKKRSEAEAYVAAVAFREQMVRRSQPRVLKS